MEIVDIDHEITVVKTQILSRLLELSEAILHGDYSKRIVTDYDEAIITKIIGNLNKVADNAQLNSIAVNDNQEQTVSTFIEVISSFANLDFKQKLPISENGTIMDAIATGINVLGDELEQSTASKQELETERNRLNEAQAIAKVGSWELDIPSFKLRWSNETFRIVELEYMSADILYKAYRKTFHPDDVSRFDDSMSTAIKKNEGFAVEHRLIGPGGSIKYIHCIGEIVKNNKAVTIGLKGTIQDVTERKVVEDKLKKAKEYAEVANNAKSLFLANMSHEIRTPLNGILGLTEIMLGEEVNEEHRKYLEIIGSSGKNLTQLINDILDFSKIESGKLDLENIIFNFNEVISANINRYAFLAKQKGLTLSYHIHESIPRDVIGDPNRISQILTNLIGNAIKFTEKGKVEITFTLLDNKNGEASIQGVVKDTGIGIPKEKESSIFQSFTQADEAVTRKYGGTGLGLSIVKSLLAQMNGDIRMESPVDLVLNNGSAFTFFIKLKLPAEQSGPASNLNGRQDRVFKTSPHILIVDDNKVNLLVAKKMVQKFGAKVTTVESGILAIDLVKAISYDMVLMDIQMPEMDGYQTTMELRRLHFTLPIVALTANAYTEDVQNSINSGMNDHIQKPYTEEKLFEKMIKFVK
jgi:signal transduction histidine kinase/CheY-like chemotaxis protein